MYRGACNCGHIKIELTLTRPIQDYTARTCDCSFCHEYGPQYVSDPEGLLTIRSANWDQVTKYRFGSETAQFIICSSCKTFVAATSKIGSQLYAVTNALSLQDGHDLRTQMVDFEGETVEERLSRRHTTWTPAVEISE